MRHALLFCILSGLALLPAPMAKAAGTGPGCSEDQISTWAKVTVPAAYMHPKMMAIGDSLFNGMTSMSIGPWLATHSVPALVAKNLGLGAADFRVAQYPDFVMWDSETELTRPILQLITSKNHSLGTNISVNIRGWKKWYKAVAKNPNAEEFFDNVSIAGATSGTLLCETQNDKIGWLRTKVKDDTGFPHVTDVNLPNLHIPLPPKDGKSFVDWLTDINDNFLLNPAHRPAYAGLSQMAEVIARRPVRLLINIGSNDALWQMGFSGLGPDDTDPSTGNKIQAQLDQLVENMKEIARLVPTDTKYVYVDRLVLPSRVANLQPSSATRCYDDGGLTNAFYFATYTPYLGTGTLPLVQCAKVQKMDMAICQTNQKIADAMQAILGPRFISVDLNSALWQHDTKHVFRPSEANTVTDCAGHSLQDQGDPIPVKWGVHQLDLDNRVIHAQGTLEGVWLVSGGIQGYDNMHPTPVGYAAFAGIITAAIAQGPEKISLNPGQQVTAQSITDELFAKGTATSLNMGEAHKTYVDEANTTLGIAHEILGLMNTIEALKTKPAESVAGACVVSETLSAMTHAHGTPCHSAAPQ
jgi:hypothetical protein